MVYAYFSYQAGSWDRKRRVVSIVEWHSGELDTCVGFIVTNLEAKSVIKWTRTFAANAARLQLHALASALGNFLCNPATPAPISDWSLSSLRRSSSRSVPRSSISAKLHLSKPIIWWMLTELTRSSPGLRYSALHRCGPVTQTDSASVTSVNKVAHDIRLCYSGHCPRFFLSRDRKLLMLDARLLCVQLCADQMVRRNIQ